MFGEAIKIFLIILKVYGQEFKIILFYFSYLIKEDKIMIGIYIIKNDINNKVYVGQSIDIEKRIKEHFWKSFSEKSGSFNSILHQAIRKYGKEHFSWNVLQECTVEEMDDLERKYIQDYNCISPNGYNILPGGQKIRVLPPTTCKLCGAIKKDRSSTYCINCGHKIQQKCHRPSREELKTMIRTESFLSLGKKFNVSDNAIRKWCVYYGLPKRKKDINNYSDEEWGKV